MKPGEPFWVALRQTIRPKWHTYWKNPGDSGLPTEIAWTLPAGAKADPIVWPAPTLIDVGGVINYGFQDDVLLLVRITPPADLAGHARARGRRQLAGVRRRLHSRGRQVRAHLPVGRGRHAGAARRARCSTRRAAACRRTARGRRATASAKSGDPTLIVDAKGLKPDTIRDVYFFPAEWGAVASMAKQTASVTADGIRIPLKKGDAKAASPQRLAGTLVLTEKTGDGEKQAFDVSAKLDPAFVPAPASLTAVADGESCRWSRRCCSRCWAA